MPERLGKIRGCLRPIMSSQVKSPKGEWASWAYMVTDRYEVELPRATVEVLELARVDAVYGAWLRVTLEALAAGWSPESPSF